MRSKRAVSELAISIDQLDNGFAKSGEAFYARMLSVLCSDLPPVLSEQLTQKLGFLRNGDPLPLVEWADSLGKQQYNTPTEHFVANQISALVVKYPFPGLDAQAEELATRKFLAAEHRCKRYNQIHRARNRRVVPILHQQYNKMRGWIAKVLGDKPPFKAIYREAGFGPGASIGVNGDATSLAHKYFADSWSVTPMALPYVVNALKTDPLAWELLCAVDKTVDWACVDKLSADGYLLSSLKERYTFVDLDEGLFEFQLLSKVNEVVHNKIVFVPKTALVHRTIAVEPLLNGYLQKGIDKVMRRSLRSVGVDLTDQSPNQDAAYEGSLGGEDPYCTIDLSSASDSMCIELVKSLLPREWFRLLDDARAPAYDLNGEIHRYHKFVSMGNGFCFPLESLLFAAACSVFTVDFRVYGDDIVVRRSHAEGVLKLLYAMGFRHNPRKTFLEGNFRESCGADWYGGVNVRPLTLDYNLGSTRALVKFCNLVSGNRKWFSFLGSVWEDIAHKVLVDYPLLRPFTGKRIDGALTVPLDEFHARTNFGKDVAIQGPVWYEVCYEPVQDGSLRAAERYSTVLMMAALRGGTSEVPFPYRRKTRARLRRETSAGATSTWDPPPPRYYAENWWNLRRPGKGVTQPQR